MAKLDNKVALVTSGNRGIGLQCVKTLSENGALVYIGARRMDAAEALCKELIAEGHKVKAVYFDAKKKDTYIPMVEEVLKEEGRLDILVNNYGSTDSSKDKDLLQGDTETFFYTVEDNLSSVYLTCKAAIPAMIKQGSGSIVNISSIGGAVPDVSRLGYCVSKGAINYFTQNIAVQYGSYGIRCNAVLPGLIGTEAVKSNMSSEFVSNFLRHLPIKRIGKPEDISKAVLFLASEDSSFITGELIEVAGGFGLPTPIYGDIAKE